ncbi:MAG TPA: hypothetical protein VFJ12_16350 [Segeticoccus sp.]|nr:hypothetical protein [Segeticoccus sp.]
MATTSVRTLAAGLLVCAPAWAALNLAQQPAGGPGDAASARAVTALVSEPATAARRALPDDFSAVEGYRPRIEEGLLVDPTGGCSSPFPLPHELHAACRLHDLGYDLLRHAAQAGAPLPAGARESIDDRFDRAMHAACDRQDSGPARAGCTAWADVASAAVRVNSWRQHWSTPVLDGPLSITTGAMGVLGIGSGVGLAGAGLRALRRRWAAGRRGTAPAAAQAVRS